MKARWIGLTWLVVFLYCLLCWWAALKCFGAYTCPTPFEPNCIYFAHCEQVSDPNTKVIYERPVCEPVDIVLLVAEFWLEDTDPNDLDDTRWLGDFGIREHLRDGKVDWVDFAILRWLWIRASRGEATTYSMVSEKGRRGAVGGPALRRIKNG